MHNLNDSHIKEETQRICTFLIQKAKEQPPFSPLTDEFITSFIKRNVKTNIGKTSFEPWKNFIYLQVKRKVYETKNICSFYLENPSGHLPFFQGGQYLTLQLNIPEQEKAVIRCYSLSGNPLQKEYRISVKRHTTSKREGLVSNYLHNHIHEDDYICAKPPSGSFTIRNTYNPVVFIAGGIGITPLLSMLHQIAALQTKQDIWLFYQLRNGTHHAFKRELEHIAKYNENIRIITIYSKPKAQDIEGEDYQYSGHLTLEILQKHLPSSYFSFYVCGPPAMLQSVDQMLETWNVPYANIHFEAFGAASVTKPTPSYTKTKGQPTKRRSRRRVFSKRDFVEDDKVVNFEYYLSEDAGNPGPVEYLMAKSDYILKLIHRTIGLKFILLANFFDNMLDIVVGYFQGIFHSWRMAQTIHRKQQRAKEGNEIEEIIKDMTRVRVLLSRILMLEGYAPRRFSPLEHSEKFSPSEWEQISCHSFPLKLTIEARYYLHQLKYDFAILTAEEAMQTTKNSFTSFIKSWIPNPFGFFLVWKDFFIIAFIMKYSREQIEGMYVDMIFSYEQLIKKISQSDDSISFAEYEKHLATRLKKIYSQSEKELRDCIRDSKTKTQRLLQMLCKVEPFIDPRKWSLYDLLREIRYATTNSPLLLELERRIKPKVAKVLKEKGVVEQIQTKQEDKILNQLYKQQRRYILEARSTIYPHPDTYKFPLSSKDLEIHFAKSKRTLLYKKKQKVTLLELAQENDIDIDYGCLSGNCHVCARKIVSGEIMYLHEPNYEPDPGQYCLCIAIPKTNLIIDA